MVKNLSAARMIGGNNPDRVKDDFYPSPDEITHALFSAWQPRCNDIWEPACGDGSMGRVIESYGYDVVMTDLVDRGVVGGVDFLMEYQLQGRCIITNPPFNLAEQFIEHAMRLGCAQMALYLKSTYWHAETRRQLFEKHRPSMILPLTWRVDFDGRGQPTLSTMWCVWDVLHTGDTIYRPVPRPKEKG